MTEQQLVGLIIFAALLLALVIGLPTSRAKLRGIQKYRAKAASVDEDGRVRPSMSPTLIGLASLLSGSATSASDDSVSSDSSDAGDFGGGDGGGGDGD